MPKSSYVIRLLKPVFIAIAVFIIANLVLASVLGSTIQSYAGVTFGTNVIETFESLMFIEGAIIFAIGGIVFPWSSKPKIENATNPAEEEQKSESEKHGEKQLSKRLMLILVGGTLLAISLILYFVPQLNA